MLTNVLLRRQAHKGLRGSILRQLVHLSYRNRCHTKRLIFLSQAACRLDQRQHQHPVGICVQTKLAHRSHALTAVPASTEDVV